MAINAQSIKFANVAKHRLIVLLGLFIFGVWLTLDNTLNAYAQQKAREPTIKAAYLYNFARLIKWPSSAFSDRNAPINLCIFGNASFGPQLQALQRKSVQGRDLRIILRVSMSNAMQCQILFISDSERDRLSEILAVVRGHPVLAVSEIPGFKEKGGNIGFYRTDDEKVGIEINLGACRKAQLIIDRKILNLKTTKK